MMRVERLWVLHSMFAKRDARSFHLESFPRACAITLVYRERNVCAEFLLLQAYLNCFASNVERTA